jgi:hypothetical protein
VDIEDFYRTNDMALVTFLKLEGQAVQSVVWDVGTCYWIFDRSASLLESVDAFMEDKATVKPKEYNRVFSQTKREFYESKRING